MNSQQTVNYNRIAAAIEYINENFKTQPNLQEVAAKINLSPFHFQRLFTEWAGVSPKKFIDYLSINYAKTILKKRQATLFEAAHETGLSGTGRLHDLFIKIEGMTPAEFKNGGIHITINYSYTQSVFGTIFIASTVKGICYMAFTDNEEQALNDLKNAFPNAQYNENFDLIQQNALSIFTHDWNKIAQIKLHLKGTPFQLKVWESLLKIPLGHLSTYGAIATTILSPKAARAVGTAIGENPIAFLIPCHRVIQATGNYGQYRWGSIRKTAMIGWEAAKTDHSL